VPDFAQGFEFAQSLERRLAVEILLGEKRIDLQVLDANVVRCRCSGKNSIRWIGEPRVPTLDFLVKRPIGLQGNRCRTHH